MGHGSVPHRGIDRHIVAVSPDLENRVIPKRFRNFCERGRKTLNHKTKRDRDFLLPITLVIINDLYF